jgi:hypothetical protein
MKLRKVKAETVSLRDYEPTKHPRLFINFQENTVCVVGQKIAIEIVLSK